VEQATQRHILSLRMGCFCNPGAGEAAFRVDPILLDHLDETGLQAGATLDDLLKFLGIPTGGAIRASFGPVSTFRDAQRLMVLAAEFRDGQIEERQLPPREQC
jgi:hypothetical protein